MPDSCKIVKKKTSLKYYQNFFFDKVTNANITENMKIRPGYKTWFNILKIEY